MYVSLSGSFGIPKESGYMQDYDWLNSFAKIDKDIPDSWYDDGFSELTNYSKHTNELVKYISTINAVITFAKFVALSITKKIKIVPFFSNFYQHRLLFVRLPLS